MEPIVEIGKRSEYYPQSLLMLGDLAPDVIYAQGDIDLLNKSLAAFICTTEITEDNAFKMGIMESEFDRKHHWLFSMDDTIAEFMLTIHMNSDVTPVILVEETMDDYSDIYGERKNGLLEEIVENGGLIIEFHYNDPLKYEALSDNELMVALSDLVAVPLCTKRDVYIRKAMKYAKELGKKVYINKEDLINLRKKE